MGNQVYFQFKPYYRKKSGEKAYLGDFIELTAEEELRKRIEEYLKTLKDPLAYADATNVQELYKAWYITYNHEYETTGI
jgi:hypothetical protein